MIIDAKKKILITTAIDYTNDVIHIGHAYEKVLADTWARISRQKLGTDNVFFVTGTDEHGTTNEKAAKKKEIPILDHVTEVSNADKKQYESLNLTFNRFIRTTDEDHKKNASEFFKKSFDNGYIYKGKYEGLYCEGCESYKTLSELVDNKCPLHPTREIQKYEEENYFFKWSHFNQFLKDLIESEKIKISPKSRKTEMLALLEKGLDDIPVTRPKFKLSWGITCPVDDTQVIYVWFDALINYHTAGKPLGFWDDNTQIVHFVGKDIARWHVLLWPAMLKSVEEKLPDYVNVHAFMNLNGQKISKSTGNIIRPDEIVNTFGSDALRWYLLKFGPANEDVDTSLDHIKETYNADLANGLGNSVARVAKLAEKSGFTFPIIENTLSKEENDLFKPLEEFRIDFVLNNISAYISELDQDISRETPWSVKDEEKLKELLTKYVNWIRKIATIVTPFLPVTSEKIKSQFEKDKIVAMEGLFPRIK